MAFRADEAARIGLDHAERSFFPVIRGEPAPDRERNRSRLRDFTDRLGHVIDDYPTWHPLVRNHAERSVVTRPNEQCQYQGIDHTICFVNGFVTCPYGDGQNVIDSVRALPACPVAKIHAERLEAEEPLYHPNAATILVTCEWHVDMLQDGTIPAQVAIPLMLERELPCWHWATRAETWDSMKSYFLGMPHGSRSSLFVNQETGQAMKKIWNTLIETGMFGPAT